MLKPLQRSEFEACADFAYRLSQDPARSGYPTYCDGIKTREDFIDRAKKYLERPDEDILLFVEDGRIEGVIAFQRPEGERYLYPGIFNIRRDTGTALAEFVDYCRGRWPGFDLDLGFPAENADAIAWLEGRGIPCNERSRNYQIFLDGYTPLPGDPSVRPVGAENFEEFAAIHRKIQGGMYWNCERVRGTLDDWVIFVAGTGSSAGELLMTRWEGAHQEVFALAFADGQYRAGPSRALLTAGLNLLKGQGAKFLTFFADDSGEDSRVLEALGFQLVGGYAGYRLKL